MNKDKKKLVVHIGYSKCGSTTIQDSLSANYELLLKEGILFPQVISESPSWLRFFWENDLPIRYPRKLVEKKKESVIEKLREEIASSNADVILLSDEGLVSLSDVCVRKFHKFLHSEFPQYDISIMVLVREPISFLTSRCQQFISDRGFQKVNIEEFLQGKELSNGEIRADNMAMNPAWMFSRNLSNYQRCFHDVNVFKFEDGIRDNIGLTHFFLKQIGFDLEIEDIRCNESRSAKCIEVISYINSKVPVMRHGKLNILRSYGDLQALYSLTGEKFRLDRKLTHSLKTIVQLEAEWLRKNFKVDYTDSKVSNEVDIVWDDTFFDEIIVILPRLSIYFRIVVYEFIKNKIDNCPDTTRAEPLRKVKFWMDENYPYQTKLSNMVLVFYPPAKRISLMMKSILRKMLSMLKAKQ